MKASFKMISANLLLQIDKYKVLPRWNSKFPPYIEQHYFDEIPVYYNDRTQPEKNFCDAMPVNGAKPVLIIVKFDKQLVFVKYNNSVLIDRLPFV